jgi:hypothetical protein
MMVIPHHAPVPCPFSPFKAENGRVVFRNDPSVKLRRWSSGVPFGRQCSAEARVCGCRHSRDQVRAEFLLPVWGLLVARWSQTGDAFLLPRNIRTGRGTNCLILRCTLRSLLLALPISPLCLHLMVGRTFCRSSVPRLIRCGGSVFTHVGLLVPPVAPGIPLATHLTGSRTCSGAVPRTKSFWNETSSSLFANWYCPRNVTVIGCAEGQEA